MTDFTNAKRFRDLDSVGSVVGTDIGAIEREGNSRRHSMLALRTYVLLDHIADHQAHGISAFFSTLTGAADLSALQTLLGITFPVAGAIKFGDILIQYGRHAIGTSGTSVASGTFSLPTAFANDDFTVLGVPAGSGNAGRGQFSATTNAASTTTVEYGADTGDAGFAIDIARDLMWIAIGDAP